MIKRVQLIFIKELAALFIPNKRILLPGVPQAFDNPQIFIGNAVAQSMIGMLGAGEVFRIIPSAVQNDLKNAGSIFH